MRVLDTEGVRRWCRLAAEVLGRARAEIDTLNVFPVPDGDTGTNMHLTVLAAAEALDELPSDADLAATWHALAQGALLGARGNSGVILSQVFRGMAEVLSQRDPGARPGRDLTAALRHASELAGSAVAHPVDGTILSVLRAAGEVDAAAPEASGEAEGAAALVAVARTAAEAARRALHDTTDRLEVLSRNGVVDAGGAGLCLVLDTLVATVSEQFPERYDVPARSPATAATAIAGSSAGDAPATEDRAYEVMYLLDTTAGAVSDAEAGRSAAGGDGGDEGDRRDRDGARGGGDAEAGIDRWVDRGDRDHGGGNTHNKTGNEADNEADETAAIDALRARLDALGDSLVIVGGDGLWNVHVHVDDAGAAIEAGMTAGRPHRIRVTYLRADGAGHAPCTGRGVVSVTVGKGLASLFTECGAKVVPRPPGSPPSLSAVLEAILSAGDEVVVLPNEAAVIPVAEAAAQRAREESVRVSVVPTKASVQGLAALAVHDPLRRFDEDVIAMTRAAGATRFGHVAVARREAATSQGICRPGDVLGLIEGDVAVIDTDLERAGREILDRMLAGGGELVTLITGADADASLVERVLAHLAAKWPHVEVVSYEGGHERYPLLFGVE